MRERLDDSRFLGRERMKMRAFLFLATAAVLLAVACNMANLERTSPKTAENYQTRGLEYLGNSDYDNAFADYKASLRLKRDF